MLVHVGACELHSWCLVLVVASWARAVPERLSAAWARSSISGHMSHLCSCYTIESLLQQRLCWEVAGLNPSPQVCFILSGWILSIIINQLNIFGSGVSFFSFYIRQVYLKEQFTQTRVISILMEDQVKFPLFLIDTPGINKCIINCAAMQSGFDQEMFLVHQRKSKCLLEEMMSGNRTSAAVNPTWAEHWSERWSFPPILFWSQGSRSIFQALWPRFYQRDGS